MTLPYSALGHHESSRSRTGFSVHGLRETDRHSKRGERAHFANVLQCIIVRRENLTHRSCMYGILQNGNGLGSVNQLDLSHFSRILCISSFTIQCEHDLQH